MYRIYFITGSHNLRHRHLHVWKKCLYLTCLTPCFGKRAYVTGFGDDIRMVCAWKQDHCSWTCRSVQTYTHAALRPTLCSALPWWHNPKFYCQCEYKSVCRFLWIVGWANVSVKALERERSNVHVFISLPLLAVRGWRWILHWCFSSRVPYCTAATLASYSEGQPPTLTCTQARLSGRNSHEVNRK